jgi:aspartate carbamoyltransferase regulatory subunit
MKQTAVEWLQEALSLTFEQEMQFEGLFQQSKEMEKQQIIKFTNNYLDDDADETVEQFYNKTFNK